MVITFVNAYVSEVGTSPENRFADFGYIAWDCNRGKGANGKSPFADSLDGFGDYYRFQTITIAESPVSDYGHGIRDSHRGKSFASAKSHFSDFGYGRWYFDRFQAVAIVKCLFSDFGNRAADC